jgi:hypothetical protein
MDPPVLLFLAGVSGALPCACRKAQAEPRREEASTGLRILKIE